jgi:hypothetical protein
VSDDLIRASGLWLKDRKGGGKFMSGQVREAIPKGAKLLVFKNDRKQADNEPDYQLFFVSPEEQPPMHRAEPQATRQPAPQDIPDDDILF